MTYSERPFIAGPPYPLDLIDATRALLQRTVAIFGILPPARVLANAVRARLIHHTRQIDTAAEHLQVDPIELTIANLSYDLMLGSMGCSTIVQPTKEGPFVARNLDWWPPSQIARASAIVPLDHGQHAAFIGMVGVVTGLSNRGFGVILNAAYGGPIDPSGYPMLLFLRNVLDTAANFAHALDLVQKTPLMSGGLITVVGVTNSERAVVERTPSPARTATRRASDDEPLFATNHFRSLAQPTECSRFDAIGRMTRRNAQPLSILTDADVMQSITAQHVLMQPSTQTMALFVPTDLLSGSVAEDTTGVMEMLGLERQL